MILFRTADGRVLVRKSNDQFFTDDTRNGDGGRYYVNHEGWPINKHGTLVFGNFVTQMHYTTDEFIKAFPEAEESRQFLTTKTAKRAIVQSIPPWAWYYGGFYIVTCYPNFVHPKDERWNRKPFVVVNDGDDSYMRQEFDTEAEAAYNELLSLAPFTMPELKEFGYDS
jgi:hypothetical protein